MGGDRNETLRQGLEEVSRGRPVKEKDEKRRDRERERERERAKAFPPVFGRQPLMIPCASTIRDRARAHCD